MAQSYIKDLMKKAQVTPEEKKEKVDPTLPFMQLAGSPMKNVWERKNSFLTSLEENLSESSPIRKIQRSESLFDPPQVSDLVILKHQKDFKPDSSIHLKERGILKYKIQSGQIEQARDYLVENFKDFFEKSTKTKALLDALQFIGYIKAQSENYELNLQKAVTFSQSNLNQYLDKPVSFLTEDKNGQPRLIHVSQVTTLICFSQEDLLKSENDFSFLLSQPQRLIIADMINNEFLRFYNQIEADQPLYSNMEMVLKHLYLCQKECNKSGMKFKFPAD